MYCCQYFWEFYLLLRRVASKLRQLHMSFSTDLNFAFKTNVLQTCLRLLQLIGLNELWFWVYLQSDRSFIWHSFILEMHDLSNSLIFCFVFVLRYSRVDLLHCYATFHSASETKQLLQPQGNSIGCNSIGFLLVGFVHALVSKHQEHLYSNWRQQ